jgi:hypothetical protein
MERLPVSASFQLVILDHNLSVSVLAAEIACYSQTHPLNLRCAVATERINAVLLHSC